MTEQDPVTLPVDNLAASTSFYLAALHPLGYRANHQVYTATGALAHAIGLDTDHGTRVDLLLSQRDDRQNHRHHRHHTKKAHVVFPAPSRAAVREFYQQALDAGGRPVRAPDVPDDDPTSYTATVTDVDGNRVEVSYTGPSDSPVLSPVENRAPYDPVRYQPPHSTAGRSEASFRSRVDSRTYGQVRPYEDRPVSMVPPLPPPPPSKPVYTTRTSPRRRTSSNSSRPTPPVTNSGINMTSKKAVGALVGTAATAALAYAVINSEGDSRRKEAEYKRRTAERDLAKAEARSSRFAEEMPTRMRSRTTYRTASRDSGYQSNTSRRADSVPRETTTKRYYVVRKETDGAPQGPRRRDTESRETPNVEQSAPPPSYKPGRLGRSASMRSTGSTGTVRAVPTTTHPRPPSPLSRPPELTATRSREQEPQRRSHSQEQEKAVRIASSLPRNPHSLAEQDFPSPADPPVRIDTPPPPYNAGETDKRARINSWARGAAVARVPPKESIPSRASLIRAEEEAGSGLVMPDDSISCADFPPARAAATTRRVIGRLDGRDGQRRRTIVVG